MTLDPETILAILAALVSSGTAISLIVTNRRNADIQERNVGLQELVAVNQGYGQLVDDLSERIDGLTAQIKTNEAEIAGMKLELAESRVENARLQAQIQKLQAENRVLRETLAELQAERC